MIPIYKPFLSNVERDNIIEAFDSSWISSKGGFINKFEKSLAEYVGRKNAILLNNGTTALHAALVALNIGPGDEVITNSFSYVATANAIKYVNAKPVFVDSCIKSWNIDADKIIDKITNKTKALLVANIYGNISGIERLEKIAKEYNIYLIEDAAESLGSEIENRKSGSFGIISTFSFFGNKTITTGEGGAILLDDEFLNSKVRQIINQGNSDKIRYYHDVLGYNYRMTNIQAAIGYGQLKRINEILNLKKQVFNLYYDLLKDFVDFQFLGHSVSSHWLTSILFKTEDQKNKAVEKLNLEGIETRPLFYPIPDLPYFSSNSFEVVNSKKLWSKGLSLPSYPELKKIEINKICNIIINICK